jgi:lipopolysaccharide/colanic/teichoic acid biosynthesis glycosyltransferase
MANLYRNYGKRLFDFSASLIGFLLISPLFLIIALLIKLQDGGSIFFKQKRVGYKMKPFYLYKFRTMVENAEKLGPSITSKG